MWFYEAAVRCVLGAANGVKPISESQGALQFVEFVDLAQLRSRAAQHPSYRYRTRSWTPLGER